jgi:hypothetical protein
VSKRQRLRTRCGTVLTGHAMSEDGSDGGSMYTKVSASLEKSSGSISVQGSDVSGAMVAASVSVGTGA